MQVGFHVFSCVVLTYLSTLEDETEVRIARLVGIEAPTSIFGYTIHDSRKDIRDLLDEFMLAARHGNPSKALGEKFLGTAREVQVDHVSSFVEVRGYYYSIYCLRQ